MRASETPQRIEPARLEEPGAPILDLLAELVAVTATLGKALHPRTAANLAGFTRIMNAYYSNLIEGHNTSPRDIERALAGDLDADTARRHLQLEAAAHVRLQQRVDEMSASGSLPEPASLDFIRWLHRELCRHAPPASAHVPEFMAYFSERFRLDSLGKARRILAMATAHHRFNYIHPFPDGNGRVSRLMSHAMAHVAGIGAQGLWSISRGLARGLESRSEYRQMMDLADTPRQGDLDGRGNLSQRALAEFVQWFLQVALDQARFMSGLFEFNTLSRRLRDYAARSERLKPEANHLLQEALIRGEFERGEVTRITGLPERSARRVLSDVTSLGLLASDTPKGPVSLRFPMAALDALFPRLYPES